EMKIAAFSPVSSRPDFTTVIFISTNCDWEISVADDSKWITPVKTSGAPGDESIDLDIAQGICYADMASLTYDRIEQDAQGEWWISGNRQKTETRYVVKLL
ncbi:hypothetical protein NE555_16655, partial [Alistipes onderdonkii]|nr:hypothetical protein [Alistipes onderdonkii]